MNKNFLSKIAQVPLGEYVWIKYYNKYRKWKVLYVSINALGEVSFMVELRDSKGKFIVSRMYTTDVINTFVFLDPPTEEAHSE